MMDFNIQVSPGELFDKISILEIKLKEISNEKQLVNIALEYDILTRVRNNTVGLSIFTEKLEVLTGQLKAVNEALWKTENALRECEGMKAFGEVFIELARSVYITNDKRSDIKKEINELLFSNLVEEKSYQPYNND